MTHPAAARNRYLARSWLKVQSLVSVALAVTLLMVSPLAAWSSMLGSLAAFLPALLFARVVVPRFGGDSSAFLRAAMLAQAGKLLLAALICVAVFLWVEPLAGGWFFAGMGATLLAGWAGLYLHDEHIPFPKGRSTMRSGPD